MIQSILDYFETIPSLHRSLILAGGITLFWIIEGIVPIVKYSYSKWHHAGINFFFTGTTIIVNFALAFVMTSASEYAFTHKFGVWHWLGLPLLPSVIVTLFLFDLVGAYLIHFTEHKVKWMWRFHLVHHTDTFVDTTSANRHHPGESVFRLVFTAAAALICGAPMAVIFLYQSLSALLSQFNHANFAMPAKLDKILSYLIVTPGMHRVHHHYQQPYTDCNYGNLFSVWDRLFGTYLFLPADKIVFGVDTHMKAEENNKLGNLLQIPFQPYRDNSKN